MIWPIRLIGCLLMTACLSLAGFRKASALTQREKSLFGLCRFAEELGLRIRLSREELPVLLMRTLPNGAVYEQGRAVFEESMHLNTEDKELVDELIDSLGSADADEECRRCFLYRDLLEKRRQTAETEQSEKKRLYQMGGVLTGLALSLLWW